MSSKQVKFTNFLACRYGLGEVSIANYLGSVNRMIEQLGETPSASRVEKYLIDLHKRKVSYSHQVNTAIALERYMTFIKKPIKIKRPKKPRRLILGVLSEADIVRLLAATKNIREKAILSLLAYSGLRNKELCCLTIGDVNLSHQAIRVLDGKGHVDRWVNVAGDCIEVLAAYLNERAGQSEHPLFITTRHKEPYKTQNLRKLIRTTAKKAGLKKRVWPYLLRHSLATNMLHRGANLLTIKEQLGHRHIETTMIYIHSTPEWVQREYKMFVPSYL